MPTIDLLPAQDDFIFDMENQFPLVRGGLGSGKSRAGTLRLPLLMLNDKEANTAYYMPTYDLLELRAKTGVIEDLELLKIPYKENKQRNLIHLEGRGDIIFRSYDRPEKIVAYEVAHSIVDELDTLKKDKASFVWRKVTERNRQITKHMKANNIKNTLGCVTTPDNGVNGFIYHKWEKLKQEGYKTYVARTYDNIFLPPDYISNIKSNYDPILADLYLNGEYVSLNQNKVYHFFDRKKHHSNRVLTDNDRIIHLGIDFNIGGTTATVFVIDNNIPIAVDELCGRDTRDLCNLIHKKLGTNRQICVYPDATGKKNTTNASETDIQILRDNGFKVYAQNSNPPVRDRINSVNGLLAHDRFFVNTDKCPELTFALESQGYDDKGDPEKFKEHPAIDDWVDNMGYFIFYKFPLQKRTISVQNIF